MTSSFSVMKTRLDIGPPDQQSTSQAYSASPRITHYRWVSQLWSSDDIRCRGSKTHSWQAGPPSEGGVLAGSSRASPRRGIFARLICPSAWVPSQLYRPTGKRGKKPITDSPVLL